MNNLIKKILIEWSYRLDDGMINLENNKHISILREVLSEMKIPSEVIIEVIGNLTEEQEFKARSKETNKIVYYKSKENMDNAIKDGTAIPLDKEASDEPEKVKGQDMFAKDLEKEKEKKDAEKKTTDTPTETEQSISGVSAKSIDSIDGDEKNKTLSGDKKHKPPGSETSAVSEIGTGDAMACLSENNNDMEKAEKCLEKKLSKTKLGKTHGTGDSKTKKEFRRGILQAAKRENQRVKEINEQLGWENSQTAHIGGSKASLKKTVDKLREKGITHINGIPIDEYEKIILGGGGAENPTDTMVCIINKETGEAIMYHTSNKMSSADIIANGSPKKEIREIVDAADLNEEEKRQAEEAGERNKKKYSQT